MYTFKQPKTHAKNQMRTRINLFRFSQIACQIDPDPFNVSYHTLPLAYTYLRSLSPYSSNVGILITSTLINSNFRNTFN